MSHKKLKMNDEKTEFLLIGTNQQLKKIEHSSISIGTELIYPVKNATDLGGWIDENMSLKCHISKTCSAAYYHLRNISRSRKFLSPELTSVLVHVFITSKLDYCNSLLYGLPASDIMKLQRIQNAASRLNYYQNKSFQSYHSCSSWSPLAPSNAPYTVQNFANHFQGSEWPSA